MCIVELDSASFWQVGSFPSLGVFVCWSPYSKQQLISSIVIRNEKLAWKPCCTILYTIYPPKPQKNKKVWYYYDMFHSSQYIFFTMSRLLKVKLK